ncbi:hypothetical protein CcI6DRAFT_02922 [Frankia sp. CcI6]|nr:hypothetical protein CcI6DRAFT_02922 [Frankia sp. CcI6]KDA40994.1 hypothetical protein BMG523Draft_04191 [Frankia sp. BMG5.23]KFB04270.1 hypothetical protein ALLO2DRAFT_02888 [Frankia sp. Allo2]OAA23500.1 hypothetical protein AAY23_10523 [Frankia casuarinae]
MAHHRSRLARGITADQERLVRLVVWIITVIVTMATQHHM